MTGFLYVKIEEISNKNKVGIYHEKIPYGEELEFDIDRIFSLLQKFDEDFNFREGVTYRISYATTVKNGEVTCAGNAYAKLLCKAEVAEGSERLEDWEGGVYFSYNDEGTEVLEWEIITFRDLEGDFEL